jgi:predicted ATP-grasp superfamily ATP-dependent carboligase
VSRHAIVVVYDLGAASPADIWRAVAGRWDIIFVYSGTSLHRPEVPKILARFGYCIDGAELSYPVLADELRRWPVAGVATFSEQMVGLANDLARDLGCRANSRGTVLAVTDKLTQRVALNRRGVSVVRAAGVRGGQLRSAIAEVGLPAVLKPRRGRASRGVRVVSSEAEVAAAIQGPADHWMLEQLLIGRRTGDEMLGDYVSVEMVSQNGCHQVLCVTDKLPMTSNLRERGSIIPSQLAGAAHREVVEMTVAALEVVEFQNGISHTEIKLTPDGPRIIEINGRLGGPVQRLVMRSSGLNTVAAGLAAAMGESPVRISPSFVRHVGTIYQQPPEGTVTVRSLPSIAGLRELAGVWRAEHHAEVGDLVDGTSGTLARVTTVDIEAGSRNELMARMRRVDAATRAQSSFS